MSGTDEQQPLIVVPPLAVDPIFSQQVDDAIAGEPDLTVPLPDGRLHSDPHDFAGLYIRHRTSFALHARRFLRDSRDVDEVVQEAFLRLFLALPELETELQALAYCRRTITNLCIDRYRADQRRPRLVDLESIPLEDLGDDDPGDPVVRAEDAALVRAALSLLSPIHRDALIKREIEEKSIPVIAEELEIAEDKVKHVLFRARRALRRILAGTQVQPGLDLDAISTARLLGRRVVNDSGRLSVALAILVVGLGLSSGPDLRAIPLVGSDLPNLPSIAELARPAPKPSLGTAASHGPATARQAPNALPPSLNALQPVTPMAPLAPKPPASQLAPTTAPGVPPTLLVPTPQPIPQPTVLPGAQPGASGAPSGSPSASPSGSPSSSPAASPSASPSTSASASPSASASAKPSASPSVSAAAAVPEPSSDARKTSVRLGRG
jgi:RNA polymerase sigma factor (sigma-70 family)